MAADNVAKAGAVQQVDTTDRAGLLQGERAYIAYGIARAVLRRTNTRSSSKTREIAMSPPLVTFEDSALIKLALAGQAECFTVLTNRHLPAVRRRIGSIVRNTTDADDLLQEVLLKVWRHLSTFRSESSFRTWMTRVAVNEALQSYRRQQSRPMCQALGDFDIFASPNESPLAVLTRAETTQVVRKAVVALPEKYRQALILRHLEQLSLKETAQCLQSSIPAVKTRLFRARLMLLVALRRQKTHGIDTCRGITKLLSIRHRSEPQRGESKKLRSQTSI
jgi:RNA polymerase sigma-70 factor (ECF subfamily)